MSKIKPLIALLAFGIITAPAIAAKKQSGAHIHNAADKAKHIEHKERLAKILADPARAKDSMRDIYRHPAKTIEFFRIHPDHVVGEYAPGGEWYTRILGRYMNEKGKFSGLYFGTGSYFDEKTKEGIAKGVAKFPDDVAKVTGRPASDFTAYSLSNIPDGMKGTYDRILIMRMLHNMMEWNIADTEIKAMRELLKPDGMIGIEQHRAKTNAPFSYTDGSKGYLREADVIKFMELNGFQLAGKSEVNANAKDKANYPDGVWTLPPAFAKKDADKEIYTAIGESDRMTLLFKKRP